MGDKMSRKSVPPEKPAAAVVDEQVAETPMEALSSICAVLVVGLFILTFLCQNFVIPSGSMEKTLLVGDHLVVDRITLAPSAKWMPLIHYREPMRGDIVVFFKPVADPDPVDGSPTYPFLVKRLVGIPGDHIRMLNGAVMINGVLQSQPDARLSGLFENRIHVVGDSMKGFKQATNSVRINDTFFTCLVKCFP